MIITLPTFSHFSFLFLIGKPALVKSLPYFFESCWCVLFFTNPNAAKQKDRKMKQKQILYIMTGSLAVSAALITSLASANMTTDRKNKSMMHIQKLDTNDVGAIALNKFTPLQDRRFAKLDCYKNGIIAKYKFNTHLFIMFYQTDRDGDRPLQSNELPSQRFGGKKHKHDKTMSETIKDS